MKKIAISFKLLLLTFIIGYITSCSNRKDLQYIAETTNALNQQQLVNRFLQVPADANEDVKKIIANIAKTEKATPFLANYAAKFGVPEWKYMFGNKNKLLTPSQSSNSNYATLGTNSNTGSKTGFFFIPLTDSVTKRTKAFIYCQQYNDTSFTYRTYDVDAILAANPTNDTAKQNKEVALGFAAYFERKINGSVQTEAFKNNKFSKANIRQDSISSTKVSSMTSLGYQTTSKPCVEKSYYFLDFGDEFWIIEISRPCAELLPEVVVISHPGGGSTGGGGGGIGGGGNINPPSPPGNPPALNNPPSGGSGSGGGGSYTGSNPGGSYPSNGYGYGPYLPPNYWDVWNPYDPNLYPWGNIYPQQINPLDLYSELDYQITDVVARNAYKTAYYELEQIYQSRPADQYTYMSREDFIDMLKANPSLANTIDPVTILVKIGVSAAADVLTQIFFTKLTDPNVHTWGEAFAKVDWWQVGATAATSIIPWNTTAGKFLVAAINGSAAVISDLTQNGFVSWEKTGIKFVEGFCGSLAGSYMGDIILKFGSKANFGKALVTKLANKIPYSTICKWLGGGIQSISKSISHSAAHGGEVTATRIMKGWAADKIAIIGRNMENRVIPFANGLANELGHPVLTWKGFNPALSEAQNLANNRAWIQSLKEEGYTFYDVGLDPKYTSLGDFAEGIFYAMELDEIFR